MINPSTERQLTVLCCVFLSMALTLFLIEELASDSDANGVQCTLGHTHQNHCFFSPNEKKEYCDSAHWLELGFCY